jgi:molybdate transport system substrate-binding protein
MSDPICISICDAIGNPVRGLVRGISSMATRAVLADLTAEYRHQHGVEVAIEAVGGVDAARRVQAGEAFDVVVLARDAIDRLVDGGHVLAGSLVDLVHSGVAVAVCTGAPRPDIGTADAVRTAVLAARSIGHSTGPSGVQLLQLFQRWGLVDTLKDRIVQAPPGVPVATLVARGEVELGFQQFSELIHAEGITVLGPLPPAIQINTTFSAGIGVRSAQVPAVRALLAFLASPAAAPAKQRHGMDPA